MQAVGGFELCRQSGPVRAILPADRLERFEHAGLHAFQPAQIDVAIFVRQAVRYQLPLYAQRILYIALRRARYTRDGEFDIGETIWQRQQIIVIRHLLRRTAAIK